MSPGLHFDNERFPLAGESRPPGDEHLRPKLLSLRVRAAGELPTRDTGGKSQVIFNLGA